MRIVMGVDGGGSKTHTVIVDEHGTQLGKGVAGCGNHQVPGIDFALGNIRQSMEIALEEAKLTPGDIDFVQYGLAGADREKDFSILRPALASLSFRAWDVVCDTMEGLRTGSRDHTGVVLVCGSGTNAAGRNPLGSEVQTGGFGYFYGDAAGGGQMAVETFRAAVRSWEQREIPSMLIELVPKFFDKTSMEHLFNDFLDQDIYHISGELTIVLHQAADLNDELAVRLLRETGWELGIAAGSVIRRLGGFEGRTVPIVLTGSVLQKGRNAHLLASLRDTVAAVHDQVELVIPEMAPVYGSVLLAMDRLGIPESEEMHAKFIAYGGYKE